MCTNGEELQPHFPSDLMNHEFFMESSMGLFYTITWICSKMRFIFAITELCTC